MKLPFVALASLHASSSSGLAWVSNIFVQLQLDSLLIRCSFMCCDDIIYAYTTAHLTSHPLPLSMALY